MPTLRLLFRTSATEGALCPDSGDHVSTATVGRAERVSIFRMLHSSTSLLLFFPRQFISNLDPFFPSHNSPKPDLSAKFVKKKIPITSRGVRRHFLDASLWVFYPTYCPVRELAIGVRVMFELVGCPYFFYFEIQLCNEVR
jgi:hypothetical protein